MYINKNVLNKIYKICDAKILIFLSACDGCGKLLFKCHFIWLKFGHNLACLIEYLSYKKSDFFRQ